MRKALSWICAAVALAAAGGAGASSLSAWPETRAMLAAPDDEAKDTPDIVRKIIESLPKQDSYVLDKLPEDTQKLIKSLDKGDLEFLLTLIDLK